MPLCGPALPHTRYTVHYASKVLSWSYDRGAEREQESVRDTSSTVGGSTAGHRIATSTKTQALDTRLRTVIPSIASTATRHESRCWFAVLFFCSAHRTFRTIMTINRTLGQQGRVLRRVFQVAVERSKNLNRKPDGRATSCIVLRKDGQTPEFLFDRCSCIR